MCDISRALCVVWVSLVFRLVICWNETHIDRLEPDGLTHNWRISVSPRVPPRTYLYFHEAMAPEPLVEEVPEEDGSLSLQLRIVGGEPVSITDVPYQVLYGMYCGGVIIAPEWVITAGHCGDKESFVLAGSTQRSLATKYTIRAHFIHPLFNKTNLHPFDYDYQLILLEKPIPVTLTSRPIAIWTDGDIRAGELVSVSGWGHTKYKQPEMEDILRRVRVPVISPETCKSLPFIDYKAITQRMFCAGLLIGTMGSCHGDSGGPAVINDKLVGLVSFGVGCAMKDQPGVYSNVPLVRGWIRSITGLPL